DVEQLKGAAAVARRRRARLCAHPGTNDRLHEMLIVHEQGIYVRPHRQRSGKSESLHVVEGELDVGLFDDAGGILTVMAMGEFRTGRPFYYRVADPFYHTLLIRSAVAVFHEITNGPFEPGDTEFATWAPAEPDREAVDSFTDVLEKQVQQWKSRQ